MHPKHFVKSLLLAAIVAATPLMADDAGATSELDALKQRMSELEAKLADQEDGRTLEKIEEKAIRPAASKVNFGGYFSIAYRYHDNGDGARDASYFDQHRFVPQFDVQISERVSFATEIEIEGGGADVGFLSGNEILVEYAELNFDLAEEFQIKTGLLLIPFGNYNLIHDDPIHDLFDRPFVARRVVPSAFDQPGVGIAGDFNQDGFQLHYDAMITQGFTDGFTNNGGARDARNSFRADNNYDKAFWTRVQLTPDFARLSSGLDYLTMQMGGSFNIQRIADNGTAQTLGWGGDFKLGMNWLDTSGFGIDFEGEYARININRDGPGVIDGLDGYYIQGSLKFRPWDNSEEDLVGGWLSKSGYIALVARWEENDLNDNVEGAARRDDRQALTVGLAFRPFLKTVIRVEYKMANSSNTDVDDPDRFVVSVSTYF